jgi:predicted dehydrogenase
MRLVAVADTDIERAGEYGSIHGAKAYGDILKMLAKEDVDVVDILTPSGTHADIGVIAARHKKHVICEKPLALRLTDADSLIAACDKHGVRLYVVKQNRYNRPVQQLKKALDRGRFGKLILGTVRVRWCRRQEYYDRDPWRGTWALDGGVLANQACHHVDLLRWLMGPVASVVAKTSTMLSDIEAEDTAVAILRFKSGALGVIEATTCARPVDLEGSLSILGERAAVEIGGFAVNRLKTWNFDKEVPGDRRTVDQLCENPAGVFAYNHIEFLKAVRSDIWNETNGSVSGADARDTLRLITALYESAETGEEVYLDGFMPRRSRLGIGDGDVQDPSEREARRAVHYW